MTNRTLTSELLFSHLSSIGPSPAIQFGDVSWSHSELKEMVQHLSSELISVGIGKEDTVLIQLPNSPEYIISFFAVISIGAIAVPTDVTSGPERLRYIAEETKAALIISNDMRWKEVGTISLTLSIAVSKSGVSIVFNKENGDHQTPLQEVGLEDRAAIIFSSGSTGRPKGVVLRHRHLLATAKNLAEAASLQSGHRELILSPMCHTDGWQRVAATFFVGGCVVIYAGPLTVPHFLSALIQTEIHGFYTPPPFVRYLLRTSPEKIFQSAGNCQSIEIGSAPLSVPELEKLMALFPHAKLLVHFGLTESSRATALDCHRYPHKLHTVGKVLTGVEIMITDLNGQTLGPDQIGEIRLRGIQCTDTYWNRNDLVAHAFEDGWLKTGDYGSLDQEGFLTYKGRRDDMINMGGFHFFPNEVELELGPIPGLKRYLIVGIPDPQGVMEQIPALYGVLENAKSWSVKEFSNFARKKVAAFKVPRKIFLVPDFIWTSSGKPDRAQTAATYGEDFSV